MAVARYRWAAAGEFVNRDAELARLETWWASPQREPINLYGRRRVGKSWLFRRFAHGKPAVILVADRVAPGQQLNSMAAQLEGPLGVRPQLDDVPTLFRLLYQLARRQKVLVVVDEFPYLLGTTTHEQQTNLSAIQAVMEQERDASKIKLVLTGSVIAQMESLQAEKSPLHGRLLPLPLRPLPFAHARQFMTFTDPLDQLTCYSVAGGMPRYLHALGGQDLLGEIATQIADRYGPFFNEPRTLLQTELREPAVYFSVLSRLARMPQSASVIAADLRMESNQTTKYLTVLESLQLVSRRAPIGARVDHRSTQWKCDDHFVRFWFRFILPYQDLLEAGMDARAHVENVVAPQLPDHTAPVFEEVLTDWVRRRHDGKASGVGGWWGPALNARRAEKSRFTEEIDTVAVAGRTVLAACEAKWTTKPLAASVLTSLLEHKLPAMAQSGFDVSKAEIILASRSGFTDGVRSLAPEHPNVILVDAKDMLS
jgi:AAA+ ATPase superfamily predicted ATPase